MATLPAGPGRDDAYGSVRMVGDSIDFDACDRGRLELFADGFESRVLTA